MNHKCAICNHEIPNNDNNKEHIIPNAIGGRKKLSKFICQKCNNDCGANWDSILTRELSFFSLAFHITRERG